MLALWTGAVALGLAAAGPTPGRSDPGLAAEDLLLAQARDALSDGQLQVARHLLDALIALAPEHAAGRRARAQTLLALGQDKAAVREACQAVDLAPDSAEGHQLLAEGLLRLGRLGLALQAVGRSLELDPQQAGAWLLRAKVLARLSFYREALHACEQARQRQVDPLALLEGVGPIWFEIGRIAEAAAAADHWVRVRPASVEAHRLQAMARARLGDIAAADKALQLVLAAEPRAVETIRCAVVVMFARGRAPEAVRLIDEALQRDHPDDPQLYALRATLRLQGRDVAGALDDARRSLQGWPENPLGLTLTQMLYSQAQKWADLQQVASSCLARAPRNPLLLVIRARAWLGQNKLAPAERDAAEALGLVPDLPEALDVRLNVAWRLNRHREVLDLIDRLEAKGAWTPPLAYMRAAALLNQQQPSEALLSLRRDMARVPGLGSLFFLAGHALATLGRYDDAISQFHQALTLGAEAPNVHAALANVYLMQHRYGQALEPMRAAWRSRPDDVETLRRLAGIYWELEQYHDGLDLADQAVRAHPRQAWAYELRFGPRLALLDYEGALKDINEAIALEPARAINFRRRAHLYRAMGRLDLAGQDHDRELQASPKDGQAWASRASYRLLVGQYEAATEEAARAAELCPDEASVHETLADCWWHRGQADRAESICEAFLQRHPEDFDGWCWKAELKTRQRRYEEAVAAASRAIALRPWDPKGFRARQAAHAGARRFEQALADGEEVQRRLPGSFRPVLAQAELLASAGDFHRALEQCEQAAARRAPDVLIAQMRAIVLADLGRYDEALAEVERLLADRAGSAGQKRLLRALIYRLAGKPSESLSDAAAVLETYPANRSAWIIKAEALAELGRFPLALAAAERAVALGPLEPEPRVTQAWVLHLAGRPAEARERIRQALVLGPDFDIGHIRAGRILAAAGRRDEALHHLAVAERIATKDHWTQLELAGLRTHLGVRAPATQTRPAASRPRGTLSGRETACSKIASATNCSRP